jgi:hypothetical protein
VIMVIVKASGFVAAVIGLLGNVGMAVSPAGGEFSQPLWGVLSSDCGRGSPKWWVVESVHCKSTTIKRGTWECIWMYQPSYCVTSGDQWPPANGR